MAARNSSSGVRSSSWRVRATVSLCVGTSPEMNSSQSSVSSSACSCEPNSHSTTPALRGIAERRTTSKRSWPGVPTTWTGEPSGASHWPTSRPTVVVDLRCRPPRIIIAVLATSLVATDDSDTVQTAVVLPTPNGPTKAT